MNNKDQKGAKVFMEHAHKIFEEHLEQIMDGESMELRFDELWIDLYNKELPNTFELQEKYCEKLLTLSSMIFLRSTENMAVLPHNSKMAEKLQTTVSV